MIYAEKIILQLVCQLWSIQWKKCYWSLWSEASACVAHAPHCSWAEPCKVELTVKIKY